MTVNDEILKNENFENKPKQKRPNRSKNMQVQTEPGDNTKYLNFAMVLMALPDIDLDSPQAVRDRVCEYFTLCAENDMKPSVAALALSLHIERNTLWKWANGETKSKNSEIVHTIKRAYQVLDALMNDYMQNGKINPVSGIFLMKNNMGYKDEQKIEVKPESPLGAVGNPDEINSRYIDSIPDDEILIDAE